MIDIKWNSLICTLHYVDNGCSVRICLDGLVKLLIAVTYYPAFVLLVVKYWLSVQYYRVTKMTGWGPCFEPSLKGSNMLHKIRGMCSMH